MNFSHPVGNRIARSDSSTHSSATPTDAELGPIPEAGELYPHLPLSEYGAPPESPEPDGAQSIDGDEGDRDEDYGKFDRQASIQNQES